MQISSSIESLSDFPIKFNPELSSESFLVHLDEAQLKIQDFIQTNLVNSNLETLETIESLDLIIPKSTTQLLSSETQDLNNQKDEKNESDDTSSFSLESFFLPINHFNTFISFSEPLSSISNSLESTSSNLKTDFFIPINSGTALINISEAPSNPPLLSTEFSIAPTTENTELNVHDTILPSNTFSFHTREALLDSSIKVFANMQNQNLEHSIIQASPAHLGPIQASMDFSNQNISINLTVANIEAFQSLQSNLSLLQSSLQNSGIQVNSLEIHHDPFQRTFIDSSITAPSPPQNTAFDQGSSFSQSRNQTSYNGSFAKNYYENSNTIESSERSDLPTKQRPSGRIDFYA